MRAIWIKKAGGPKMLEVRECPEPSATTNDLLIDVKAAGLNFAEVSARQGLYPAAPKTPCIVGYEGAGVVRSVGANVRKFQAGDRVLYMCRFGGHASVVAVPETQVAKMPEAMSFEEGAAIPVAYLTAHHILHNVHRTRPGDRVLVHMAAGGVGTATLQLLRNIGGVTSFGTASASKHDYVRSQGCTHVIDYRSEDYALAIARHNVKLNLVIDPLGALDWRKGYGLLEEGGLLVCCGLANAQKPGRRNLLHVLLTLLRIRRHSPLQLMEHNRAVAGVDMGGMWHRTDMMESALSELAAMYESGVIKPHIDGVFPFERAAEAHARLEYGKNLGKVVLVP